MASQSLSPDPEPETGSETGPHPRSTRNIPRSCNLCNRRKVRCDKKEPCAPCTRAGKTCDYPPSGGRVRRPRKTIMADMASRISDLEKSLVQAREGADGHVMHPQTPVSGSVHSSPSDQPATATPGYDVDRRDGAGREDILVQKGSSSQYFNEIILSRVIGEEQGIQSVLATPASTSSVPVTSSPFNTSGILSAPSMSELPSSFHPPRALALRLWTAYVENVEGCPGLKILHVPTDEVKVYAAINNPSAAPFEDLSLVFAIYYAAVVSLDEGEAEAILGQSKLMNLARYKMGLEQALAHANFLDNPSLTGLHTLAIYLSAVRVHNRGKGLWILNGLAIRIAQSMGLHRDGERLGLTPFQSEIRRRLWWHFIGRDGCAGELYGLQNTTSLYQMSDIGAPRNLNDADLYPDMKELPPSRKGWTAMTSSLINVDITKALYKLAVVAAAADPSNPPGEEVRRRILGEAMDTLERRLQDCNPVIPRHLLTMTISRFIAKKLDFITRQQWQLLRSPGMGGSFASDECLVQALEILELGNRPSKDEMLKSYAWVTRGYPQYHLTLYILWHLCVRPEGPNTDKAWAAVDSVHEREAIFEAEEGLGPKAVVIRELRAKAQAVRERLREANAAVVARSSDGDATMSSRDSPPTAPWNYSLGQCGTGDAFGLNINGVEYPAWETLVHEFRLDGENFPNVFWQ